MKHVIRMATCLILAISVLPLNSAFAGEYDDDFATVSTWLGDINGKLALVYSESTNILMQLNQRTISNTYTLRYYIEETYNDQHNMLLQFTTLTQNNSPTIRNYVSTISSNINNLKTSVDSLSTDIDTIVTKQTSIATNAGNIYARLGTTNTTLSDTYTFLYNWQSSWVAYKNQLLDWGTSWNTTFGTISTNISAINNNLITGFTSIEGKLDTLHTDLTSVTTAINNLRSTFTPVIQTLTMNNGNVASYLVVKPMDVNKESTNHLVNAINTGLTNIASIIGYVDGIETKLDTLHNDLTSVTTAINNLRSTFTSVIQTLTMNNGNVASYLVVKPMDVNKDSTNHLVNAINTGLDNIASIIGYVDGIEGKLDNIVTAVNSLQSLTVNVDTSGIEAQLSTITGLLSVPSNTNTIVGDLDSLQFEDDVDDLVDELSNLAPFGAVFLLSSEIGLIVTANTIQTPQFTMPFNFFGQNNVVIDLSWLVSAKPFLNFLMMFLLVYSLAVVSMKYARNEATS